MKNNMIVIIFFAFFAASKAQLFCAASSYHPSDRQQTVRRTMVEQILQKRWTLIKNKVAHDGEINQFPTALSKAFIIPQIARFEEDIQSYLLHLLMLCYLAACHENLVVPLETIVCQYELTPPVENALKEYEALIKSKITLINWDFLARASRYWQPTTSQEASPQDPLNLDIPTEDFSSDLSVYPLFPELATDGLIEPLPVEDTPLHEHIKNADFFTHSPLLAPTSPAELIVDEEDFYIDITSCSPERNTTFLHATDCHNHNSTENDQEFIDILTVTPPRPQRKKADRRHPSKHKQKIAHKKKTCRRY